MYRFKGWAMIIKFDHMKLVKRNWHEVERFQKYLRGMIVGVQELMILHEDDNSCCRKEAWNATLRILGEAAKPNETIVAVNVNDPETMP